MNPSDIQQILINIDPDYSTCLICKHKFSLSLTCGILDKILPGAFMRKKICLLCSYNDKLIYGSCKRKGITIEDISKVYGDLITIDEDKEYGYYYFKLNINFLSPDNE